MLGYLHTLGIDILIFTPAGAANLEYILSKNMFCALNLENINTNVDLRVINEINKLLKKFKVDVMELDNSLENLGYNAPIKKYQIRINLFKTPILKKIGKIIKGWQLTLIGTLGLIISISLVLFNTITFIPFLIVLKIIVVIFCAILILGVKLLSLDM